MAVTGRTKARSTGRGHYVMDLYYPDESARDGFRREVLRIEAADDAAAIAEAGRIDGWRMTSFYCIRAIRSTTRSGDVVIHDSRTTPDGGEAEAISIAPTPERDAAQDGEAG